MHSHTQCRKGGNKLIESLVPFKASTVTVSVGDANMQVLNNNALASYMVDGLGGNMNLTQRALKLTLALKQHRYYYLKTTDTAHTMFAYMHADSKSCHWHHYQQQQSTAHTHKHALVYELLYVTLHVSEQLQMLLQIRAVSGAVTPNLAFRGIEQQCAHSCCDAVMTIRHTSVSCVVCTCTLCLLHDGCCVAAAAKGCCDCLLVLSQADLSG
eukprot:2338-Heterococcus_DN1.PRE.12